MTGLVKQIGKITRTSLGYEDHGILTAYITFDFGGSGQSFGGYGLDEPLWEHPDANGLDRGEFLGRRGVAWGMEFVARVIKACGVDSWEKLPGRTVFVLREKEYGPIVGIEPLPTEQGKRFLVADLEALVTA